MNAGPKPPAEDRRAIRRRRAGEAALVLGLLVAGALVYALAGDGELALAVGSALMGFAGVAAVSAVFYEIGRGEDRERGP